MRTVAAANLNGPPVVNNTGVTTIQIFPAFVNLAATTVALSLAVPGSTRFNGKKMLVRAAGFATVGGTSPTLNLVLQSGTSLTSGSNTTLATLGSAQAVTTSASYPWMLEAILEGDSTTGKLQGAFSIILNNVVSAWAALSNGLTGLNFATEPVFNLVIGVTFGVANAANTATLTDFSLLAD